MLPLFLSNSHVYSITEPYCDFSGGYCEWIAYGGDASFKFKRTTPKQSAEAGEAGPTMDVDGGNGGYAVVALGNTAADEAQPSMFYGPPSIELWENRTYCFQFTMQLQVSDTCAFYLLVF